MENEYIKEILMTMGVPKISFDFADPSTILLMFIFSTEAFVFLLAIIIWVVFSLFKSSDKWSIKEQQDKNMNSRNLHGHSYDSNDMRKMAKKHKMGNMNETGNMHKMKQEDGFISILISKFIIPVSIIFIVLYVGINMAGLNNYG